MRKILLTVATLLALAGTAALAETATTVPAGQPPPGERNGHHKKRPPHNPLMAALDTNRDGELSADEIARAPQSLLELDQNHDGKIDRQELRPPRPERGPDANRPAEAPAERR